ncbi:complement C1q-like protein 4 [Mercenaria mercenaria]|uniref:complement C1q-like protein 4 n=1 Tax=Mercenaria mercenaria TaxID=6596 RepID=UPI00234ED6FF|nr:complement C1q-like protein 4 [Mercenaria mercenaria]
MATFLFGILLITCLGNTRSETDCVSEKRFNELEEIIRVKFEDLKNENNELKEKLLALETKLEYYESHRKESPADQDILDEINTPVDESVTDIRNRINRGIESKTISGKLKRQESTNIAFYTYLGGKRCYGNHETFVYDVVETNVGNGYNSRDGIFDVPVTGVYVFTATLVPDFHQHLQAEIIVDGVVKGIIFTDSEEINDIHQASTSIIVHVNAGDHVYIRRGRSNSCNVISDTTLVRTTFAGWLLF